MAEQELTQAQKAATVIVLPLAQKKHPGFISI